MNTNTALFNMWLKLANLARTQGDNYLADMYVQQAIATMDADGSEQERPN